MMLSTNNSLEYPVTTYLREIIREEKDYLVQKIKEMMEEASKNPTKTKRGFPTLLKLRQSRLKNC